VPKLILGSLVATFACAIVTVVLASPQFAATFQFTYSSSKPATPAGFDGLGTWSDPGEPARKPKELVKIKLSFHHGTRIDTSALPVCKASDERVQRLALHACPSSTRLGSVKTEGAISDGSRFSPSSTLYNAKRQIIVVVMLNGRLLTNFRDEVGRRSVTINLKLPPGVSLTRFEPHVPRHVRGRLGRRKTYFRTPRACPASRAWTTTATYSYRDGSSQQLMATTPCKPLQPPVRSIRGSARTSG
jgi:hypothetical protein